MASNELQSSAVLRPLSVFDQRIDLFLNDQLEQFSRRCMVPGRTEMGARARDIFNERVGQVLLSRCTTVVECTESIGPLLQRAQEVFEDEFRMRTLLEDLRVFRSECLTSWNSIIDILNEGRAKSEKLDSDQLAELFDSVVSVWSQQNGGQLVLNDEAKHAIALAVEKAFFKDISTPFLRWKWTLCSYCYESLGGKLENFVLEATGAYQSHSKGLPLFVDTQVRLLRKGMTVAYSDFRKGLKDIPMPLITMRCLESFLKESALDYTTNFKLKNLGQGLAKDVACWEKALIKDTVVSFQGSGALSEAYAANVRLALYLAIRWYFSNKGSSVPFDVEAKRIISSKFSEALIAL